MLFYKKKKTVEVAPASPEPQYFVNGRESEHRIHLGSYYRNPGDREGCFLVRKDGEWFLSSMAFWPFSASASNGGSSDTKLDGAYFAFRGIRTAEDLLGEIYRGNLEPCRELLREHADVLLLLEEIVKSKTAPNYCREGISLRWEMDAQQTGVTIHKIYSCGEDILTIPPEIEGLPVTGLGHRAAFDLACSGLILPDTIREVNGINGCRNLRKIVIPASAEKCCPFLGCSSLENIYVARGSRSFCSVDGVLYSHDRTKLLRCPEHKSGVLEICDRTTVVGHWACMDCIQLTGVIFPKALVRIDSDAFKNCINVTEFVLPDSIREIFCGAFANIARERIRCKKGSCADRILEKNFSNPGWHGRTSG